MSTIPVHDLELHHETRGSGPPVLFISGATGDAGHWTEVGEELSADFTVISYDRRGNSRSPAPPGWTATSIAEQADDAAALLEGLGTAPCAVVGNSLGAIIACALVEQHPGLLHTAVLHEPPLLSIVTHGDQIGDDLQSMIGEAVQEGGFPLAMDRFLRGGRRRHRRTRTRPAHADADQRSGVLRGRAAGDVGLPSRPRAPPANRGHPPARRRG